MWRVAFLVACCRLLAGLVLLRIDCNVVVAAADAAVHRNNSPAVADLVVDNHSTVIGHHCHNKCSLPLLHSIAT